MIVEHAVSTEGRQAGNREFANSGKSGQDNYVVAAAIRTDLNPRTRVSSWTQVVRGMIRVAIPEMSVSHRRNAPRKVVTEPRVMGWWKCFRIIETAGRDVDEADGIAMLVC
jgi:hypothetical protein